MGVTGLRVIDASVIPLITNGHTTAPTVMIAEVGSNLILEQGRKCDVEVLYPSNRNTARNPFTQTRQF